MKSVDSGKVPKRSSALQGSTASTKMYFKNYRQVANSYFKGDPGFAKPSPHYIQEVRDYLSSTTGGDGIQNSTLNSLRATAIKNLTKVYKKSTPSVQSSAVFQPGFQGRVNASTVLNTDVTTCRSSAQNALESAANT